MSIHDEIQETLPGYALGALEKDEAAKAEAHLASCRTCSAVLEDYRSVADSLALAVPMVEPPRSLRARTMQRALSGGKSKVISQLARRTAPPRQRNWFMPALVGATLVLALAALALNLWENVEVGRQIQAQRDMLTVLAYQQGTAQIVRGTDRAPSAVGRLYLDLDSGVAALVTVNMPSIANDRVYQVWLTTPEGLKSSGGIFQTDSSGNGLLLVRAPQRLSTYVQVGVTVEPAGGSSAPTTEPVLLAKLPSQ